MIVSPFTPLFFINRKTHGLESEYVQTFAPTDIILLEIFCDIDELVMAEVIDECAGSLLYRIEFNSWEINDKTKILFTTISLNPGCYSVRILGFGKSEIFRVTDDERVLSKTTLIQYSMSNNRQRNDVLFFIDHMQYFFDFRVPGGFKDSNWTFGVESEQFVTPNADIVQLYGLESTQKKFTLGSSSGVPVWYGEMLNRILVCSHVYFDGVKYCRKDSNVPEMEVLLEGVNSFVFTQTLQQSVNLDPMIELNNQAIIRRIVDPEDYRSIPDDNSRLIY